MLVTASTSADWMFYSRLSFKIIIKKDPIHSRCLPGGWGLVLHVCGGVVQRQQHLDGGQLGGGRRGGAAVIIQGHSGHRAAPLTLGRQQERSSAWVLRRHLEGNGKSGHECNNENHS